MSDEAARMREMAARVADEFEAENMRGCADSIMNDPVLKAARGDVLARLSASEWGRSQEYQDAGASHSAQAMAARNIAAAIRSLPLPPASEKTAAQPFAYFAYNQGYDTWEQVVPEHKNDPDVVAAYREPVASDKTAEAVSPAARDVLAERQRQKAVEGWTAEHDDQHSGGEIALAAACYAASTASEPKSMSPPPVERLLLNYWPWNRKWWKPKNRRRDLVRAGALILAEIERLDRAALSALTRPEGGE